MTRGQATDPERRVPLRTPGQVFEERAVRRDRDRDHAPGPKARRTRATILSAAAELFAAQGYQRTTVADVAAAAGVSLGTVYQYFLDRRDLVAALVQVATTRMLDRADTAWHAEEGVDGLHRVLHNFVSSYAEVGAMARVWEEVTHVDDDLAELRRELGRVFTGQVEREIRRAAARGAVRDDVDAAIAARALSGMVDRYCYVTYAFDPSDDPPSAEESAEVLTKLWQSAISPT